MPPMLQPALAESLCEVWAVLHKDSRFRIPATQIHYLTAMALMADDDIVSHLLLKKLRLARPFGGDEPPPRTVVMNSFVEFRHDGDEKRFCQLVHPSEHRPSYGLGITSLEGAGLIGLEAGQTILWPNRDGRLAELHIVHSENCPGLSDWLRSGSELA